MASGRSVDDGSTVRGRRCRRARGSDRRLDAVPSRGRAVRDLWIGALLVYGLLLVEDPGMLAVRVRLAERGAPDRLADAGLAAMMLIYNYAASRRVVGVAASTALAEAMDHVDRRRAARVAATGSVVVRIGRSLAVCLNPFALVKRAGGLVGRAADRLRRRWHGTRLEPVAAWFEDLGMVNLVGVPAASLAIATARGGCDRRRSLRHGVLFVGSWFAGARAVGALVGAAHSVPVVGPVCERVTWWIGRVFTTATDPTRPAGAVVITLAVTAVVRYAVEVQRWLHRPDPPVVRSVATPGTT